MRLGLHKSLIVDEEDKESRVHRREALPSTRQLRLGDLDARFKATRGGLDCAITEFAKEYSSKHSS